MEPYGSGKLGILVIGEAPGKVEDRNGMPWQGRTGRTLQRILHKYGIDLFKDCVCINAVNCRPPDNRTPYKKEINCCREVKVNRALKEYKPKVILLLGATSVESFLGPRWPIDLGGITKWRGWRAPDQDYDAWVVPTFHPSFVVRADSREYNTIWEQDLKPLADLVDKPVPRYKPPEMHFIEDLSILEKYMDAPKMAFDYETTGLKAKLKGHRIVSASCAFDEKDVYSFLMPKTKAELRPWFNLLTNKEIKKMAHNMRFEHQWTLHRYGVEVQNWYWDSMNAAHQLDNRSYITGLKFQTYVNFGVIYGDEVLPFLRKNEDDPRGFNRIHELLDQPGGTEKLLKYGAYDSHYEYRLANRQLLELDYELPF
jgi:DNA polymerase